MRVIRGLKREDSAILTGLQLYHNFVRPTWSCLDNQHQPRPLASRLFIKTYMVDVMVFYIHSNKVQIRRFHA